MSSETKKLKETSSLIKKIIKSCKDIEKIDCAMNEYFIQITDPNNPNFQDYNKLYSLSEIAKCKSICEKPILVNYEKKQNIKFSLLVETFSYEKAPDGVIIVLMLFNKKISKDMPLWIDVYIKKQ